MHLLAERSRHSPEMASKLHRFFMLLQEMLPCGRCRANYKDHLNQLPIPKTATRNRFVRWVYELHRRVNLSRGIQTSPDYGVIRDLWHKRALTVKDPYKEYDLNTFLNVLERGRHREFWSLLEELLPITHKKNCSESCL
jgi:hypothetical protein